jgi:hypothetical protein
MLKEWLRESYCAVAPKRLAALVAGGGGQEARALTPKATGKAKAIARKAKAKAKRPATSKKRAARARARRRAG